MPDRCVDKQTNLASRSGERGSRICILGGGFAGLYTALHLDRRFRSHRQKPKITLIDRCDRFLFTPLLYERITGELKAWEIAPSFQKLLDNTAIQFRQGTVRGVDLAQRQVNLDEGGVCTYDYLVLAVGRKTSANLADLAVTRTYPFRTLEDADRLSSCLQSLENSSRPQIRVAIVGGGPSGVELAGKIADRLKTRGRVCLLSQGDRLLKNFSIFSQQIAERSLLQRGVEIELNAKLKALSSEKIAFERDNRIQTFSTDITIGAIGTQPRQWLLDLDCQHDSQGKLFTQPTLQLAKYPEVFALGDLADIRNGRGEVVPATAQAAFQQASHTARNLQAAIEGKRLQPFRYLHLGEMLTLGINNAVVSSLGIHLGGSIAAFIRQWVYILLRMPTVSHRFEIVRYRFKLGIWETGVNIAKRAIEEIPRLINLQGRSRFPVSQLQGNRAIERNRRILVKK